jgi:hypothetical protein
VLSCALCPTGSVALAPYQLIAVTAATTDQPSSATVMLVTLL